MAQSLACKYRPSTFEECCGQRSTIKILQRQLELGKISHTYLFTGPSGVGKTTLAKILANKINKGIGTPIEIDAASNNGVDNVREIIASAQERSVDGEYKIFIIDEVHGISSQAWQAFLKCIEEPPEYTIFMFCTTNPEKVPEAINNRCQRYNLTKIPLDLIVERLKFICKNEGFSNFEDACDYIAKISMGCMRQAIAYLEQASDYSYDLKIDNVLECLGDFSYKNMFKLTDAIVDGNQSAIIELLSDLYLSGKDMKLFIESFLDFTLDLTKYCIFKNTSILKIPSTMEDMLKYSTGIENNINYFNRLSSKILDIKNKIKDDPNTFNTIQVMVINASRGDI